MLVLCIDKAKLNDVYVTAVDRTTKTVTWSAGYTVLESHYEDPEDPSYVDLWMGRS